MHASNKVQCVGLPCIEEIDETAGEAGPCLDEGFDVNAVSALHLHERHGANK